MPKKIEQSHKQSHKQAHESILRLLLENQNPKVRETVKKMLKKSDRAITFSVTVFETEDGGITTAATIADPHIEDDTATPCVLFIKDWIDLHVSMMDQFFEVIKDRALGAYELNDSLFNLTISNDATKH